MGLRNFQKSEFVKLIISFLYYFCCQNWDQWHKYSGKNTHIIFFYFWFKNKRVWAEKNGKIPKTLKLQAITLTSNSHQLFKFFTWKIKKNQLSDFYKLLRLCAISALQTSKKHFFFVKKKLVPTVQAEMPQP